MGSNPKMTMTYLVTNRSWQLADLSRTVDDGMLVFECERRNLPPDCIPGDATELRVNLQLVLKALLDLLRGAGGESSCPSVVTAAHSFPFQSSTRCERA